MRKILLLMAIISAMTAGCGSETNENGVVATVNGRCIHLTQLETEYDFKHMDWSQGVDTNVEQLKSDYSRIVLNLVVEELVSQELQRRGLSVTDEELKAAEDRIRADYPEGAFEQVLIEEYIDLNEWRGRLKARLAMEKFYKEVLRPRVKLDYEEAEAYYREHISDFYLPDRIRFYLIQAPSEEMIKRALDIYETNGSVEDVSAKFNRVQVLDLKQRKDRLPVEWLDAVESLEPGQASRIISWEHGYMSVIFLEEIPGRVLEPSQAYPLVESILLERKMEEAFDSWLAQTLKAADIRISPLLIGEEEFVPDVEQALDRSDHNASES